MELHYADAREVVFGELLKVLKAGSAYFIDYPEDLSGTISREFTVGGFNPSAIKCIVFTTNREFYKQLIALEGSDGSASLTLDSVGVVYYVYFKKIAHDFYLHFTPKQRDAWGFKLLGGWPKMPT